MRWALFIGGLALGFYMHKAADTALIDLAGKEPKLGTLINGALAGASLYFVVGELPTLYKRLSLKT